MPITNNVHWDERLEAFKGRDTTHYVITAAAGAEHCADCREPLRPEDELSLIVDIQQGKDFGQTGYRHYDSYVCHRSCQAPELGLREVASLGVPEAMDKFRAND